MTATSLDARPATISLDVLSNLLVATPCSTRWEDMKGDGKTLHCDQCNLNVHNFEAMTSDELLTLLENAEGRVCGRLFRRSDGKILTADCPSGLALVRAKARRTAARLVAMIGTVITAGVLWAKGHEQPSGEARLMMLEPFATVHSKLSPAPPVLSRPVMGDVVMGTLCVPRTASGK